MTTSRPTPARYTAGDAYAIASPRGVALVSPEVDPEIVEGVWQALASGGGLAGVLDAATGSSGRFADVPPFGMVVTGEPARVLVRGAVEAHVTDAAGRTCVLSGTGVATWAEHVVADARAVALRIGPAAGVALPIVDGIVRAGGVTVVLTQDAVDVPLAPIAPPVLAPIAPPVLAPIAPPVLAPIAPPVLAPTAPPVPALIDTDGEPAPAEGEPADAEPVEAEPADAEEPSPEPLIDVPAWVSGDAAAARSAAAADDPLETVQSDRRGRFAHLWGETVMASVAAAAVADAQQPAAAGDAPRPDSGGESLVRAGDHDGATVSLAAARAMRARGRAEADLPPVPAPPVPAPPAPVPPPALGRLELSTGRTLVLDRGVVIGRRPRATRVGDDVPQLVTVESPSQDISRSHIEVRREGESAVVVDLDTTNGTVLHRDGSSPMRLHPGEATILLDGDALDLGDEVTVTYREG
ncbi:MULTISPECIES: FHA domain-containing protein [unclassified Microbacterium]|uniref:FHA domain-containing protein n=1 Tax=unclassified Microbacterium TaxID=2609290 RepID=UPI00214CAB7A|nr:MULTISPECIES: FHA domain-containing protein [unclassified Microbacterium]MCR2784695.1 FHA domain-containing protein [Microbacterium sp. zg.B96]WIM16235.1 FHA domain-containing protein [Microbacterium sp. zg-B96]